MQSEVRDSRAHSPEVRTLCPQPRRALQLMPSTPPQRGTDPGSPYPSSPEWASTELRELLAQRDLKFHSQAASPAFSQVSTSAGPTPVPERLEPTPTADLQQLRNTMTTVDEEAALSKENEIERKCFVGGIPQELNQEELLNFFSTFTRVQKAWIQKQKFVEQTSMGHLQNHRGFGFIIFADISAVKEVLGNEFSRFVMMPNGRRLEVKRAVSSAKLELAATNGWSSRKENSFNLGAAWSQANHPVAPRPTLESQRPHAGHKQHRLEDKYVGEPPAQAPLAIQNFRRSGSSAMPGGGGHAPQQLALPAFPLTNSAGFAINFPSAIGPPPEIMGRTAQELESLLKQAMPENYDD